MKRIFAVLFSLGLAAGAGAQEANPKAIIHTTDGDITVELYASRAPKTVENFIGLSTGKKPWRDPKTNEPVTDKPLYNGTIFHRTIPNFMIQGGDPLGTGTGGPGYRFEDEFHDLAFDSAGILAMANAGPGTNGSQFFITVAPTPHLTNRHTIFGKVTAGMDIVNKIVNKPTVAQNRPVEPTVIKSIEIVGDKPAAAPKPADAGTTTPADGSTTASQN